jgi:hypothetical protein
MFLGLPDPHPDPLVTSTGLALDPATAPDPSFIKQNSMKNIDSNCLRLLYNFLSLKNDVNAPVVRIRICNWIRIRMLLGLPDPHPDPLVRGMDPRIRIRIQIRPNMSQIRNIAYWLMTFRKLFN